MKRCYIALVAALFLGFAGIAAEAKTFRYSFLNDAASLDPHALAETFTLSFLGQLYEPLVDRGPNLELVPGLATSWEQPEPNVWRFKLRQGAKFGNGESFSADDVDFSINCATNFPATLVLDEMEEELGKPIIDSIAVTFWKACLMAGVAPILEGWGALMRGTLAPTPEVTPAALARH